MVQQAQTIVQLVTASVMVDTNINHKNGMSKFAHTVFSFPTYAHDDYLQLICNDFDQWLEKMTYLC